ncbi:3-oxoacyl-[acyl-carrier protein] reductase [Micromonospora viridifaciens]|uniref:3-oxoacyl-[acyl-carrier protein] reductase n=1 Tax=Micromonospora viridifaciens TaxID=1881 RepID=A0A1C4X0B6_MICVI|nr:3-oxoacyl-ACP reductase family protein [Micromonospora viridifaciens]SCF01561.1 3-oxoacyl-[acyl-carrier protein] reductase [Micromonospora viridifaciens]
MATGLAGKVAVVTGSSRGIGKGIAVALAREGAKVVVNGLDDDVEAEKTYREVTQNGGVALLCPGDMTDEAVAGDLFDRTERELGGIDILVNNVGGGKNIPFLDIDEKLWHEVLDLNLHTTFRCIRLVLPGMLERGFGRIINIASQLGVKGGFQLAHYATAKAGLIGLTRSLALEFAGSGVTVNAIAPGRIQTELRPGAARVSQEWLERKLREIPMSRFGRVEEVAATAVLIASSPSGDFYTGQTFHPNGGEVMP